MIAMTLASIAAAVGGEVDGDPSLVVTGPAYLDSRTPEPGGLFVAMIGERADGHDHAAGAHAVLASRPCGAPAVVVRDPVVALARLARHVVDAVEPTVLAVTGSHGKTGTKDLLGQVLPGALASRGNLNNELGVPLTALRLVPATDHLVLEMGARGVGHLTCLSGIAPPSVAAVTAVGSAHLGEFGSRELVARAKGELVELLPSTGVAVLNADDPLVAAMADRTRAGVLTFGRTGEVSWRDVTLDDLARPTFDLGYAGRWVPVSLQVAGAHQVANAAAAAAMALAVGEPLAALGPRLSAALPASPSRMGTTLRADGVLVVDDSYNANPESVAAALEALVALGARRPGRTVAVLGGMRELGPHSPAAHREVAALARRLGVDVVLAVDAAAYEGRGVRHVPDLDTARAWLDAELQRGGTVLVKGSRAAGLDRLAIALLAAEAPTNDL